MQYEVEIELKTDPGKLSGEVKHLNKFFYTNYLRLELRNLQTGKKFKSRPYGASGGMLAFDMGKSIIPFNGGEIKPWKASFPLVMLKLEPGLYECIVEFSYPGKKTGLWSGTEEEWETAGFWSGTVKSAFFDLTILKETPKTKKFTVPTRLRLEKGLRIHYGKKDSTEVKLPVRNGYFIGTRCYVNGFMYRMGGLPPPGDVNSIDKLYEYKGGDIRRTYTIEIFETSDRPVHFWHPGPGSGGYKVLWKWSYTVNASEEEVEKLKK